MTDTPLDLLGRASFVSLSSFRRDGTPVATTVWLARDGDALVVTTMSNSGKVKRIRRDPHVTLVPCGRGGKVEPGTARVDGTAGVIEDPAGQRGPERALRGKYRWQYRLAMLADRLRRSDPGTRVILRITGID